MFARNGLVGVEVTESPSSAGASTSSTRPTARSSARRLSEDEQTALVGAITFTTNIADAKDCQAASRRSSSEALPVKQALFRTLDGIVAPDAILATNTSSLSVTRSPPRPRVPGGSSASAYFNPAPVQHLVEIIRTVVTEPDVLEDVAAQPARSTRPR